MYTISKKFQFSASHRLAHLPADHKCHRLHGHNYEVEVVLAARELDGRGFVIDYADLAPLKNMIDERLDHRHLNDVVPELWAILGATVGHDETVNAKTTTAENLAAFFYRWCKLHGWPIVSASVSETPKTVATYSAA